MMNGWVPGGRGVSSRARLRSTHLHAPDLALVASEATLCMGPAHRHDRRERAVGSSLINTLDVRGKRADVGAYEEVRGCGQKSVSAAMGRKP